MKIDTVLPNFVLGDATITVTVGTGGGGSGGGGTIPSGAFWIDQFGNLTYAPQDAPKTLAMDKAVSAMHQMHTRNGRPSRFMPELE